MICCFEIKAVIYPFWDKTYQKLPRGMGGADFSDESDSLEEGLEDSEGNGKERKRAKRSFGEKRV